MNPRTFSAFLAVLFLPWWAFAQSANTPAISREGQELSKALDRMDVTHLWRAGVHVDWKTGKPDGKTYKTTGSHTHCSAFVAAACQRLGIYILRPPDHSSVLLANAQYNWLPREGAAQGWKRIKSAQEAQRRANEGQVVVAVCKNPNPKKPGHIAFVRPSTKNKQKVAGEGPDIIQAGRKNYSRTSLKEGFKYHPRARENGDIHFFAHAWSPE